MGQFGVDVTFDPGTFAFTGNSFQLKVILWSLTIYNKENPFATLSLGESLRTAFSRGNLTLLSGNGPFTFLSNTFLQGSSFFWSNFGPI